MSVFIIAEAGVNHNGKLGLAKSLVDKAKEAGADCIKFQTFVSHKLVSKDAAKADYQKAQKGAVESQLAMLQKLELSFKDFIKLKEYCDARTIKFLSTAFDFDSINFLNKLGMRIWKVPSGEITNLPYLIKVASMHQPIFLSTGMSTIDEIQIAVDLLNQNGCGNITLLHCTTEYPAPYPDVNLRAMQTLKEVFNLPVGYSDHTKGIEVAVAAVALGATVIEKHFTLDCNMEGPDHKASLEPDELARMVSAIRNVEQAMGTSKKLPTKSEMKNMEIVRKSIVASRSIKQGEVLSENNLTVKRPGTGISPMRWFEVIGQKAIKDFEEDELIVL